MSILSKIKLDEETKLIKSKEPYGTISELVDALGK